MMPLLLALLVLLGAVPAAGQEPFPSRTVTIVNPYPPGGQADLSGRPFVAALQKVMKQSVVITNKPGAAGNLEIGYLNQFLGQRNGRIYEFNNTLHLSWNSRAPVSRLFRR